MLAYAEKIAIDASVISAADIARLRKVGFSDRNVADIALCAAFRCFVARYFDAVGAGPEESLHRRRRGVPRRDDGGKELFSVIRVMPGLDPDLTQKTDRKDTLLNSRP